MLDVGGDRRRPSEVIRGRRLPAEVGARVGGGRQRPGRAGRGPRILQQSGAAGDRSACPLVPVVEQRVGGANYRLVDIAPLFWGRRHGWRPEMFSVCVCVCRRAKASPSEHALVSPDVLPSACTRIRTIGSRVGIVRSYKTAVAPRHLLCMVAKRLVLPRLRIGRAAMAVSGDLILQGSADLAGMMCPMLQAAQQRGS